MVDLTLVLNFHAEGHLAKVSTASAAMAVQRAKRGGNQVRLIAVMDRPDELTRSVVESHGSIWDGILECDFGDLGLARNFAVDSVATPWLCFMDGDDLCGDEWLVKACLVAETEDCSRAFLHPEWIFYFNESDLLNQSQTATPRPGAKSFYMRQVSSTEPHFDANVLRFNNVYTSNQLGMISLYKGFPFRSVDHVRGFGVEDWTWNATGLAMGVRHLVVPETVHLVRVREIDSLGKANARANLLPELTPLPRVHGLRV